jgi:hypothetical protein
MSFIIFILGLLYAALATLFVVGLARSARKGDTWYLQAPPPASPDTRAQTYEHALLLAHTKRLGHRRGHTRNHS